MTMNTKLSEVKETIPQIKVGRWVVLTEDGIWDGMGEWTYPTKKSALDDISACCDDERMIPKVKRVDKSEYWYYPKRDGRFTTTVTIKLVTKENSLELNEIAKEQWENDPLSEYD